MKYKKIQNLSPSKFKRLCGVRLETNNEMTKIVKTHFKEHKKTGRPSKLSIEDQILMTLEYLREYRTYFHIGQSWATSFLDKMDTLFDETFAFTDNLLTRCPFCQGFSQGV